MAAGIANAISTGVRQSFEPSYFAGLAGDAVALRALAPGSEDGAIQRLHEIATPAGWPTTVFPHVEGPINDLVLGNAGVVLTALWSRHPLSETIAEIGCEALMAQSQDARQGLTWRMHARREELLPNFTHGTAGIAAALATAGHQQTRSDWISAATRGAEHLVSIAELADGAMRVPHYVPHGNHDEDEYTYSWCHGPTGTSYLFLALAEAGVTSVCGHHPLAWHSRCLQAVINSDIPVRVRPGFWDNDGRCCGTAGVGEMFLDDAQRPNRSRAESHGSLDQAAIMADALVERAISDFAGTRWRFLEHRVEPPQRPPGTGWMQGAAGIAAFLFRIARVSRDGVSAPILTRPDNQWAPTR